MSCGTISCKAFRCRQTGRAFSRFLSVWLVWITLPTLCVDARTVAEWDFSYGMHGWKGNHHVTDLIHSRQGLSFTSTGVDPWIEGPAVNLRTDRLTKVTVRMKSNANSTGELFYGPYFQAGRSVRFAVNNDNDVYGRRRLSCAAAGGAAAVR
ncbi:MAG: hypothetical protein ISS70_06790 [Phycisphaerae bacterium]|nr:hypothetical protein [Phycisphaerae bacterium]